MNGNDSGPAPASRRLAAIDIGSNSIRLLVADAAPDGTYRILDDEKRTTRLAHGLARTSVLAGGAMDKSIEALAHMKAIVAGYEVEQLHVIATSAVREAANSEQFLERVRQQLGMEIEVIPTALEGELSFASAARHFDLTAINSAVVDLGGGSAEIIFAAKGIIEDIHSLPLGAVRLTETLVGSDAISEGDFARLKKRVRKCLEKSLGPPPFPPQVMIGAGGTFLALANISMRRRGKAFSSVGGYELERSEVRHILDYLRNLSLRDRKAVPGLNADRADIIVAGVTVIERLMKHLEVNRLLINDQGVRDGLLQRMISQAFQREPAGTSDAEPLAGVRQFAAACALDQKHPEHVTSLARQLFEQLQKPLQLKPEDRTILEAAALLHEVGYLINYEKHHLHSLHMIVHGNIRGLTPRQRELVANVARYHRRATPKRKHDNYARLLPSERETVRRLAALLRLADGFDRTHTQNVKQVRCDWEDGQLVLTALADSDPEVDLWNAEEKGKFFERVFGAHLQYRWEPRVPAIRPAG